MRVGGKEQREISTPPRRLLRRHQLHVSALDVLREATAHATGLDEVLVGQTLAVHFPILVSLRAFTARVLLDEPTNNLASECADPPATTRRLLGACSACNLALLAAGLAASALAGLL